MAQVLQKTFAIMMLPAFSMMTYAGDTEVYEYNDIPVVITPTRLKQSLADVPAAVTVITAEDIQALGIRTIPEALRLVPGFIVNTTGGNDYRLEYHGTNGQIPRRMQVLIDGMTIFGGGFLRIYWERFPVSIDNVERIEVTRSAASATYGANAMLAVVNVVTKKPQDTYGLTASVIAGSLDTRSLFLRYSNNISNTYYHVSVEQHEDDGFDKNYTRIDDRRDGIDITRLNISTSTQFTENTTLDIQAGYLDTYWQDEFEEENQTSFPDADWTDWNLNTTLKTQLSENHELKFNVYGVGWEKKQGWSTCYPTLFLTPELRALSVSNENYANAVLMGEIPSGGTAEDDALAAAVFERINNLGGVEAALEPTCGNAQQDYRNSQYQFELQDTYVFNDDFRVASGLGITYDKMDSETYFFNKPQRRTTMRTFATMEYRLNDSYKLHAGLMAEKDNEVLDLEFSPRLALNYRINDYHTLKFVISRAIRKPDFIATNRDWNYIFRDIEPLMDGEDEAIFFIRRDAESDGDTDLEPEKILSREIIYYLHLPEAGILFDLKLYNDRLYDMMSEDFGFFVVDYTNDSDFHLKGYEFQLKYQPSNYFWVRATFNSNENTSDRFLERTLYAKRSGSLSGLYKFNNHWSLGFLHYQYSADNVSFFDQKRSDLILSYSRPLSGGKLNTKFTVRNQPKDQGASASIDTITAAGDGTVERNLYDDNTHYYFTLEYLY